MRPMYVLRVDLSSLVIRPPYMGPTKLNQKPTTFVTSFSQTSFRPRPCALQGQRHHRGRLSARPATKKAANELAEGESVNAALSPAKFSNAAGTAAFEIGRASCRERVRAACV